MARIVYLAFPGPGVAGGQKMIMRHVEALNALGYEAVFWMNRSGTLPAWFAHAAPVEVATPFRADDILVVPEDAPNALASLSGTGHRVVVFCQNHYSFAAHAYPQVAAFPAAAFPAFIAVGRVTAASIGRSFPQAQVEIVPCFADEEVFRPGAARRAAVAVVPRKRAVEARAIRGFFSCRHPRHAGLPWVGIDGVPEAEVARTMGGASLFLSLARLEAVGMTALEAMACGCVVAGFTGIGGREFATAANGFWVDEDDCEAAADALARAADLVLTGGGALRLYREAAAETARAWSRAAFRDALERTWARLAPGLRRA